MVCAGVRANAETFFIFSTTAPVIPSFDWALAFVGWTTLPTASYICEADAKKAGVFAVLNPLSALDAWLSHLIS
jgi:hypothetical protein